VHKRKGGEKMTGIATMPREAKKYTEQVKIDSEVLHMARVIAALDGVMIAELISEALRPLMLKRIQEERIDVSKFKAKKGKGK
jgi:N-dimethylarginine dimethylaminohydrolase